MVEDALAESKDPEDQRYDENILIRGCKLSLPEIKAVYRELQTLNKNEGKRVIDQLVKPIDVSEEDFAKENTFLLEDAFKLTVSIIGFDGQTAYGETERIFDSKNLPFPIRSVFFTNNTAFEKHANGVPPKNSLSIWLHFDKPPLFDPNPLVSSPTLNTSCAKLKASDLGFFRAAQSIIENKLRTKKRWYSFIHETFAYDAALWFLSLPYALYWVSVYSEIWFPADDKLVMFKVAFYIYGLGLSLLFHRALFSYVKWAFPVNILEENKDHATKHRFILGIILIALVGWVVNSIANNLIDL